MKIRKRTKEKLIRQTEGIISLLLILLLVPFYLVASILAEVGRFQSALRGYDSAISASEISVLSNYDEYLMERFGLLAVSQDIDIDSEFWSYLSVQDTQDTRSFSASTHSADGVYPLADTSILRQQIEEFSTYIVPTQTALDFSDISNVVSQLESYSSLFNTTLEMLTGFETSAQAMIDTYDAFDDAKKQMKNVVASTNTYRDEYKAFQTAINNYQNHLATERPVDSNEATAWDSECERLKQEAENAKSSYQNAIAAEISNISSLSSNITAAINQQKSAEDSIVDVTVNYGNALVSDANEIYDKQKKLATTDKEKYAIADEKSELNDAATIFTSGTNAAKQSDTYSKALSDYNEYSCSLSIDQLNDELNVLGNMNLATYTSDDIENSLGLLNQVDLTKFEDASSFNTLIQDTKKAIEDEAASAFDIDMLDALLGLFKLKAESDPYLNSVIDVDYYKENFGGIPSKKNRTENAYSLESPYEESDAAIAKRNLAKIELSSGSNYGIIGGFSGSQAELQSLSSNNENSENFFKKILNSVKVVKSIVGQISNMFSTLSNIKDSIGNDMLLKGYLVYDCSNRVNYQSGASLAGMSFASSGGLAPVKQDESVTGQIATNLTSLGYLDNETHYSFCGAELEYLIGGKFYEQANQAIVYNYLLLTRIAMSLIPVCTNSEVQAIANTCAAVPYVGPILKIVVPLLFTFADASIDMVFLVNGDTAPLIKTDNNLNVTAEGIARTVKKLNELNVLSAEDEANLKKLGKSLSGEDVALNTATSSTSSTETTDKKLLDVSKWTESLNEVDYTQFVYLWMILFYHDDETLLNRFVDIIQMEQTARDMDSDETSATSSRLYGKKRLFDVDKTYTTIRVSVNANFVNVLPVPTLSKNSTWTVNRMIYRGY